jgi:hypothetical protein
LSRKFLALCLLAVVLTLALGAGVAQAGPKVPPGFTTDVRAIWEWWDGPEYESMYNYVEITAQEAKGPARQSQVLVTWVQADYTTPDGFGPEVVASGFATIPNSAFTMQGGDSLRSAWLKNVMIPLSPANGHTEAAGSATLNLKWTGVGDVMIDGTWTGRFATVAGTVGLPGRPVADVSTWQPTDYAPPFIERLR